MLPEDEINERYRHLLQPLRDISANWQMSIQEHLDDYLEKLQADRERNMATSDGEIIKFNFAEAALLIQGSLKIFAQKVDFLYEAISEAYMGISNNKQKKKKNQTLDPNEEAPQTGRMNTDFDLVDEKQKMLSQMVDTHWLLQNDRKRENKAPVRVGQRRDFGRRDRFVDLPISFIPTKKSAPSAHHFKFEHNNESIYVCQSDLCSYNAIVFANDDGTDMTMFINSAYLQLVHQFSAEFIPYLRDENSQRLTRIAAPYNTEAPPEVYQRILELDKREQRNDEPHSFLAGDEDDGDAVDVVDLVDFERDLRPASVEAPLLNEFMATQTQTNGVTQNGAGDTTLDEELPIELASHHEHNLRNVTATTAQEPELDVDEELAYLDEYAEVKVKLRRKPGEKEKKKPRNHVKASVLCEIRDKALEEKFKKMGKDYDRYKNNLSEYITAKLFSRRLCTTGSALENLNPSLRQQHVQALNRVFYAQEKYEKSVKAQRKKEEQRAEMARRKAERRKRKELQQAKQLEVKRRRLTTTDEASVSGTDAQNQPKNLDTSIQEYEPNFQEKDNPYDDAENDADYFGAQPDEDDLVPIASHSTDEIEEQYNPAALMEREINEMINDNNVPDSEVDEELPEEINIFATGEFTDEPQTQDVVLGDNAMSISMSELQTSFELGTFATNDPSFFDLDKLAELFTRSNFELITDDQILLHSIQNFWSVTNQDTNAGSKHRLQQWSSHILARVDEDTRHKPFEIHEYGTAVLESFGENPIGHVKKFREIIKGVPKYEVSRYLLAVLILANCGNVEIINEVDPKKDRGIVDIVQPNINKRTSIKLLSLVRHHEVFQSEQLLITS